MLLLLLVLAAARAEPVERKWAAIAVPLVAYDSSMKLGLGGFAQLVVADREGDRPYKLNVDAQVYKTTGGWDDHYVGWDLPGAFGGPIRWDARARYQRWTRAPYYGMGNDTPRSDDAPPAWYRWESERPFAMTHLRVAVGQTPWELYLGALASWVRVEAGDRSLLASDRPAGIAGGAVSTVTLGAFLDTRTDEVDPTDGVAVDLALRAALPEPLSDYAFAGGHGSARGWWRPVGPLVLAGHVMVDGNVGETPFFEQAIFGGLQRTGIGGRYLLRGLGEERLRGDAIAATQGELRFQLGWVTVLRRLDFGFALAPFVDAAQLVLWDEPTPLQPHVTGGAGLRVNLNRLLVLRVDLGVAAERWVEEPSQRPQVQLYMLSAQPF